MRWFNDEQCWRNGCLLKYCHVWRRKCCRQSYRFRDINFGEKIPQTSTHKKVEHWERYGSSRLLAIQLEWIISTMYMRQNIKLSFKQVHSIHSDDIREHDHLHLASIALIDYRNAFNYQSSRAYSYSSHSWLTWK